jgi:hypothetical protein
MAAGVKNCFKCSAEFEYKRASTALCADCREDLHQVRRNFARRQRAEQIRDLLNRVLPDIPESLHQTARALAPKILDGRHDVRSVDDKDLIQSGSLYCPDIQPSGTKTARGSDDGRSTYFADLAGELDTLESESAKDSWWTENSPSDVFFLFDEPEVFDEFMKYKRIDPS